MLIIFTITVGALAFAMKVYLHFKLLSPGHRNFVELGRYFGIDFFLPVVAKFDSRHLRNRKAQANRMLIVFYSCVILTAYLMLMNNSGF
ncbi:MAG: hypothetical protein JSS70_03105 [Bacteroidetes bacterium]|nr:hypothetical protein [Bacteroidota bacterium]